MIIPDDNKRFSLAGIRQSKTRLPRYYCMLSENNTASPTRTVQTDHMLTVHSNASLCQLFEAQQLVSLTRFFILK